MPQAHQQLGVEFGVDGRSENTREDARYAARVARVAYSREPHWHQSMLQYSEFTKRVAGRSGYAWAIHMDALKLRDAGQDVIMLTVGDPDQPPPEALIDTAVAALRAHHTGYSGIVGYPALRQAIAKRHTGRTGRPCAAENVVIVPGAQGGLFCALLCLAGPGDEVIVPEPVYATYERVVGAAGRGW